MLSTVRFVCFHVPSGEDMHSGYLCPHSKHYMRKQSTCFGLVVGPSHYVGSFVLHTETIHVALVLC